LVLVDLFLNLFLNHSLLSTGIFGSLLFSLNLLVDSLLPFFKFLLFIIILVITAVDIIAFDDTITVGNIVGITDDIVVATNYIIIIDVVVVVGVIRLGDFHSIVFLFDHTYIPTVRSIVEVDFFLVLFVVISIGHIIMLIRLLASLLPIMFPIELSSLVQIADLIN